MKNFFKTLYKYWMKFSHVLGTISGFIILTVFYFIIIGLYALPFGLVRLLKGHKNQPLSYWKIKENRPADLENLKFQF
ncbi:MAG: hypothetical protein WC526_03910 [Patescibacteria group bacterium]